MKSLIVGGAMIAAALCLPAIASATPYTAAAGAPQAALASKVEPVHYTHSDRWHRPHRRWHPPYWGYYNAPRWGHWHSPYRWRPYHPEPYGHHHRPDRGWSRHDGRDAHYSGPGWRAPGERHGSRHSR